MIWNDLIYCCRPNLKLQKDVKSSEDETSDSEESQSGDESDEVHSEIKKPGSTRLAKIMPAFKRLKTMPSSIQKKLLTPVIMTYSDV